jgi:formate hydrogenlyase subunit 6/NADH:ubiquinone oxidoreductase subunit I
MFCGLCVEACPYNALYMGRSYEQGRYSRRLLWADMETLMSPEVEASSYGHPEMDEKLPQQTLLVYGQITRDAVGEKDD